jgi:hypothetical protein
MSKDSGPWQDGRRAWERLNGWHQDDPSASPGHPDSGPMSLSALSDIGLVRHLLDQAELVAVRTARRHGKSWAEIATKLGVTRQSAWERWRDLDDSREATDAVLEAVTTDLVGEATRNLRRQSRTKVPYVVGLSWASARERLYEAGLRAVGSDPDARPLEVGEWAGIIVTDQSPESGARVPQGTPVRLWTERRGGSAGVREPRRPKPDPRVGREVKYLPSDEAVG